MEEEKLGAEFEAWLDEIEPTLPPLPEEELWNE